MARKKYQTYTLTDNQIQIIKDNYLVVPPKKLGAMINLPAGVIKRWIKKLALIIPDHIKEQRIASSRFKKGSVPFNKGKKQTEFMSEAQIERTKNTRFKKNAKPHNTYSDNLVISKRKDSGGKYYKWIKISHGCWELLHVFNWHRKHGRIPDNKIVAFKDGDQLNCEPNNLVLLTRAENLQRNRKGFLALPPELKQTINLINKVNRQINKQ